MGCIPRNNLNEEKLNMVKKTYVSFTYKKKDSQKLHEKQKNYTDKS